MDRKNCRCSTTCLTTEHLNTLPHHACISPVHLLSSWFSPQILRTFRQAADEQRKVCEGRYRGVLLEAVQDAIYLSAQNQQLQADIKQLREGQSVSDVSH